MTDREPPTHEQPTHLQPADDVLLPGLDPFTVEVDGATVRGRSSRTAPGTRGVVLLLHGYPQTSAMWHHVAPALVADGFTVVAPDLRGYGASTCHDGEMTFRAMAADQPRVLEALGLDPTGVHVVGHDRGARTAHRLVLDHPGLARSVALLDILPTLDVWEQMDAWLARRYFHWTFLIQGGGLPERLIDADPQAWLDHALGALGGTGGMTTAALEEYAGAARVPSVVHAWCEDYRAGARTDLEHDRADRGRTVDLPALVLWGEKGVVGARADPVEVWRTWFPAAVGHAVPSGHFLAEQRPEEVLTAVRAHLDAAG